MHHIIDANEKKLTAENRENWAVLKNLNAPFKKFQKIGPKPRKSTDLQVNTRLYLLKKVNTPKKQLTLFA